MGELFGLIASVSLLGMTFVWTTQTWKHLDQQISKTKDIWQVERQAHACGSWLALQKNVEEFKTWLPPADDEVDFPLADDANWMVAEHELLNDLAEHFGVDKNLCALQGADTTHYSILSFRQGHSPSDSPPNWTYRFGSGGECGSCTDRLR